MTAREAAPDRRLQRSAEVAALVLVTLCVLLFLALPVISIIERALKETSFFDVVTESSVTTALRLSIETTAISLAIIIVFGTPVAYLLSRAKFPGVQVLDALIDLPIVLPPAVGGLGLLLAFGRHGLFGEYLHDAGIDLAFTTTAVIMAQTFVASPFYIRSAKAGFDAVDPELESVAYTLGSSRSGAFLRVAVPVATPSLMAGAVMAWARALGEFGATIMFAGSFEGRTQTVPLAIYRSLETGVDEPLALSAVLVVVSFVVLFVFRLLVKRSALTL